MMVVLLTHTQAAASVSPEALRRLSSFGVTNITLLADEETLAVVLDGWAFDPDTAPSGVL